MNLLQFIYCVDETTANLSHANLAAFVHDIARVMPEGQREDFLKKLKAMERSEVLETPEDSRPEIGGNGIGEINTAAETKATADIKKKLKQINKEVKEIESGKLCLIGSLNEEYDDWYNSSAEEFLFEDPENVIGIIINACDLIHQCIQHELYQEGYELAEQLTALEVTVGGEYGDYCDPVLSFKEVEELSISSFDYKQLIRDALCAAYWTNPLEERPEALYRIMRNSALRNITLEAVIQNSKKDLDQLPEFLNLWIQYLGKSSGAIAERLLTEAAALQNDSGQFLETARMYSAHHPRLYEQFLRQNLAAGNDKDAFRVGQEAMQTISQKYIIRGKIALLTAVYAHRLKMQKEAELCWLEAFRSDTSTVNYLRLATESTDYSVYREEAGKIIEMCFQTSKKENTYQHRADELCENRLEEKMYHMLTFFDGRFQKAVKEGMAKKEGLGWSFTFMKEGIALFLLYLYQGDHLPAGCSDMRKIVCQSASFTADEYSQGLCRPVSKDSTDLFWTCFRKWKEVTPMTKNDSVWIMEKLEDWIRIRVEGIMQGNYRNHYGECAAFIAALGEVRESRGVMNGKANLMKDYRDAYSRRSAFHRELRAYGMRDRKQ